MNYELGSFSSGKKLECIRVARFFFVQNIPKQEKYTTRQQTVPNIHEIYKVPVHKIFQMVIKYNNVFQDPPKYNQIGIFGMKTIWQPWSACLQPNNKSLR
jgi:hypothetical protein